MTVGSFMLTLPRPRFRFYGSGTNYGTIAADVLSGRVGAGDTVRTVESEVADFVGSSHAIAVPQARVGIYLALKALIRPGQDVILSPYTIYEVINMVLCAGGRPVFADIERETCNIDLRHVESLIDGKTGAVLITHLHGLACDGKRAREICDAAKVPLLEDAAQAFGARFGGQMVGTYGDAGVYSFGMAKNVNSLYGGMVVTDDADLAEQVRVAMSEFPLMETRDLVQRAFFCMTGDIITSKPLFWAGPYWLFRYGCLHNVEALNKPLRGEGEPVRKDEIPKPYLKRLTPMQARLVRRQLAKVDAQSQVRLSYARLYYHGLKDLKQVLLPPMLEDGSHIYQSYPIQVPDRFGLLKYLTRHLRDITVQHMRNTADMECFDDFQRDCPNARATADQVLLLPTYPSYGLRDVERNIELVRRYFETRSVD